MCLESLEFRLEWISNSQKKCETFIQHLGFKHRMILNHMPDEIFEEFKDILRADMQHHDRGLEIPCLACPQSTKKFMCTSNYISHLIQKHYLEKILSKYNLTPENVGCPACKICTPDNKDNGRTWFARHLVKKHGLIYEFAEEAVAIQLRELGVF